MLQRIRISLTIVLPLLILLFSGSARAVDYYVALDGSNLPSRGTTPDDPFRTITYALSIADTTAGAPHTIHIGAGTFNSSSELYPLPMVDQTTLVGEGPGATILDATGALTSVVAAVDNVDWALINVTVTGGIQIQGGGIRITQGSGILLQNLVVRDNTADYNVSPGTMGEGGGLFLFEANDVTVDHVLFMGNTAVTNGGAVMVVRSSPTFQQVTISGNECSDNPASSAVYSNGEPGGYSMILTSSVVWGNPSLDGMVQSVDGAVAASYSLIETDGGSVFPGTGNVWDNPLFVDAGARDFSVLQGSVIVDLADPSLPFADEPQPNGGRANAGVYGGTSAAQISGASYTLNRYRWAMIGLPVAPEDGDPGVLFGDELGEDTGDETWRLMRWDPLLDVMIRYNEPEADGLERGDPPPLQPGRGYLIRQNMDAVRTINTPGHALDQSETVSIPLAEGSAGGTKYSMVANPFPYPVNLGDTQLETVNGARTFDEAAADGLLNRWVYVLDNVGRFVPTLNRLNAWEGAVMVTMAPGQVSWTVPPGRQEPTTGNPLLGLDWAVRLDVTSLNDDGTQAASDLGHLFGIGPEMANGLDPYDALDLTFVDRPLHARFLGTGTRKYFHSFQFDGEGYYRLWQGEVVANPTLPDTVRLSFAGLSNVDPDYGFQLIGEDGTVLVDDLRNTTALNLRARLRADGMKKLRFSVLVSHPDWTNDVKEDPITGLPVRFTLDSVYPNPFNGTTSLTVAMPHPGELTLAVYDVLGRRVARLDWGRQPAGLHRFAWQPEHLASGVYFLKVDANGEFVTRKVILLQ